MLFQLGIFLELEERKLPRNIKIIAKGFEISGFGIVGYYARSENGHMITIWDQEYSVTGLPKDCASFYQNSSTHNNYKGVTLYLIHMVKMIAIRIST